MRMKGLGGLKGQLPPCLPMDPKSGMGQVRDTREPNLRIQVPSHP